MGILCRFGTLAFPLLLSLGVVAQTATDSVPPPPLKPGWWLVPGTDARMSLGGYVKFDLIHDLTPIGSPNFFDVSKIPTDGSTGSSTHLQAVETRLSLDLRRNSNCGELRAYVEGDFYGSGGAFRLRHAYAQVGTRWLFGQTWSTFMDETIIPATLDYEKPAAYAFARHAQVRYTQPIGAHTGLAIALEQPSTSVQAPGAGTLANPYPDVVMRVKHEGQRGHVVVAGFLGGVEFRPDSGQVQNMASAGVNVSGLLQVGKQDKLMAQMLYGPGIARYRFGKYAAPDENGELTPITGWAATFGYLRHWNETWSSFFTANYGVEDPLDSQPGSDTEETTYASANLLWHFAPKAYAGVEYLHGMRLDVAENDGTADRIMLSVQLDLK